MSAQTGALETSAVARHRSQGEIISPYLLVSAATCVKKRVDIIALNVYLVRDDPDDLDLRVVSCRLSACGGRRVGEPYRDEGWLTWQLSERRDRPAR